MEWNGRAPHRYPWPHAKTKQNPCDRFDLKIPRMLQTAWAQHSLYGAKNAQRPACNWLLQRHAVPTAWHRPWGGASEHLDSMGCQIRKIHKSLPQKGGHEHQRSVRASHPFHKKVRQKATREFERYDKCLSHSLSL